MNPKPHILYLEDDTNLGLITSDVLKRNGFNVTWVTDGEQGLERMEKNVFDIGIVDIMMPLLDGYTFIKKLREQKNMMPIVLLSARVLTEDVLKGFEIGADDYMRKPFSIEELIARVNRLLKKPAPLEENLTKFRIGMYEYYYDVYKLAYKNKPVTLSPRSGEILYRLINNKDNILPRSQTLIDLWGDDNFFTGRSLDVFISKLRTHLSEDPSIKIINIRGSGYRLMIDHSE